MKNEFSKLFDNLSSSIAQLYKTGGALLVFIFVGVLTMIIGNFSGGELSSWIFSIGAIVTIACLFLFVYLQVKQSKKDDEYSTLGNKEFEYDLFVSAPMTSVSEKEYKKTRNLTLTAIKHIKDACQFQKIYFAGQYIDKANKVDPPSISANQDLNALRASKYYLLIYPSALVTSTIVEAGYALALKIPSLYLVHDINDLPFMLRGAAEAYAPHVRILQFANETDLPRLIDQYSRKIFMDQAKNDEE